MKFILSINEQFFYKNNIEHYARVVTYVNFVNDQLFKCSTLNNGEIKKFISIWSNFDMEHGDLGKNKD